MMRELVDRFRYRFARQAQEQRAERYGADGNQPCVDRRWRLLLFLILLLNVAPWALWLIAALSGAIALIVPVLFWIEIPAAIFGSHLFEPATVGHMPTGTAGWFVAISFWTTIAIILWALISLGLSSKQHHLTKR
jgi:hypothetical protein